jgi:hypothetical protein
MAYQGMAIGKTTAVIAVIVLVTVAAIGIVLLVPQASTNSATSTPTMVSTSTAVSTGPVPSVSNVEVANVTVTQTPLFVPGGMAIDSNTSAIYVSDGTDNLTVVDASTYTAVDTITLPGSPDYGWGPIAIDSESNMIYVSTWGCTNEANVSNSCVPYGSMPTWGIVEIDGHNNTIVGKIPVTVDLLTVDSSTGILYGTVGNDLLAIDEHSGSVIGNLSLGASPQSIAVDAKTNMVYVDGCKQPSLGCIGGELLGIGGAHDDVQFTVPLNVDFLSNVVVDANTNTVYLLGTSENATLYSIDGTSGAVGYASAIAPCGADAGGVTLAMNTASNQLYFVSNSYFAVIDATTGRIVNMLSSPGTWDVAVSPDGSNVYLAIEAGNEQFGYLLVIPSTTGENYVNLTTLAGHGGCLP